MVSMLGGLFKYGPKPTHIAFKSGTKPGVRPYQLVLVGGLTDGLLFAPYAQQLATALEAAGWGLVQAQLSSSYQGYGTASLDQDADELLLLSKHLGEVHGCEGILLMGHSTGSQDVVRFAAKHASAQGAPTLVATILQAPVSDREYLAQHATKLAPHVEAAKALVAAGKREQIVARWDVFSDDAPVTARRLLSFVEKGGDDDMFSSDLSDEELQALLSPLHNLPSLILVSGKDECIPENVETTALGRRLAAAAGPKALLRVFAGAPHSLEGYESAVASAVVEFIGTLPVTWYVQ